jgi:hypothetical protein
MSARGVHPGGAKYVTLIAERFPARKKNETGMWGQIVG